jgi:hypothetical protein
VPVCARVQDEPARRRAPSPELAAALGRAGRRQTVPDRVALRGASARADRSGTPAELVPDPWSTRARARIVGRYFWRVSDGNGRATPERPASWEMGLLKADD